MTILGYSSSSLERVRRHDLQPPARYSSHQVPAEWVPQPAGILHPEHLQQDERDGERFGGPPGQAVRAGQILGKQPRDLRHQPDEGGGGETQFD